MPPADNRAEYAKLSRQELIELLVVFGRQALVLDGLWFLGVEERWGHQAALAVDEQMWHRYGANEAGRLMAFLGLERVDTLEDVRRVFLLTPVWGLLGARAEVAGGRCHLWVTDCLPQKARTRKGLGEFACQQTGVNYFQSFLSALNPRLRFSCAFCPPGEHPSDQWCRWEVWFAD